MSRYAETDSQRYLWHIQQLRRKKRARRREDVEPVGPEAVGGTETVINPEPNVFFRVHSFTDVGESSLEVLRGGEFEYLIVGGGGGGGALDEVNSGFGGGGAGGFIEGSTFLDTDSFSLTVGSGGPSATNGFASVAFGLIALGGGAGADGSILPGNPGGSGGGSGGRDTFGGAALQPSSVSGGFGNRGGNKTGDGGFAGNRHAPGGGGAGAQGQDIDLSTPFPGFGGVGRESTITGASVFYAGGGGGGAYPNDEGASYPIDGGKGGQGGGGQGGGSISLQNISDGQSAEENTGGGGGGAASFLSGTALGGNGGSGIVIVRYRISQADFIASGGVIA